jgi:hypothetical protein
LFDGRASLGLRLPINTLDTNGTTPAFSSNDTDIGDLGVITKYVFWQDGTSGSLLSGGLVVTAPTGPSTFAGANIAGTNSWNLQPYVGYIFNRERFYIHGFQSFAFATKDDDITFYAFDLGAGWRLYQSQCGGFLTGIIPTAEVHVNIPLNHRGALDINDPVGTADVVDLTFGVTFVLGGRSTLALGYVTPVTGPRPFDYELLLQFNWRFGAVSGAPTGNILGM